MSATADALMAIFGFKRVEDKQMKSDRELLELAAKSAGISIDYWAGDCPRITTAAIPVPWNPLTDDGDALRLAVKLRLDVLFSPDVVEVMANTGGEIEPYGLIPYSGDDAKDTRRAIVRAAAAIGEGME